MGITVISSVSASPAVAALSGAAANIGTLPGGTGTDALPLNFAALLSGQIPLPAGTTITTTNAGKDAKTKGTTDDASASATGDQNTLNPALAFLMTAPAPGATANIASTAPTDPALDTSAAANSLALLGNFKGLNSTDQKTSEKPLTDAATSKQESFADQLKSLSLLPKADDKATLPLTTNSAPGTAANIAADSLPLPANLPASQDSAATLAASANAAAAQQKATAQETAKTEVSTPLHSANWGQDFGQKIVWMAKNDQQSAQININPPQLGPVQITLQLNGDQASAVFSSPHAEVRQAIESSMSQLRDMLSASGINLGQADVGSNMAQQNREAPFQSANGNRSASENAILPGIVNTVDSTVNAPIQRGRGLVDLFA